MSRKRNGYQPVPQQQLGFGGQWSSRVPTDTWGFPSNPALQRTLLSYESRQISRPYNPYIVNKEMRIAMIFDSILLTNIAPSKTVKALREKGNRFRQRTVPKMRMTMMEQSKKLNNKAFFDNEISELQQVIRRKHSSPSWMTYSMSFSLGPSHLEFLYSSTPDILHHRSHQMLAYPSNASVILMINRNRDGPHTKECVENQILKKGSPSENDYIYMSSPKSGYATKLKYGEDPEYLNHPDQIPFLVVVDELCPNVSNTRAIEIYEKEFGRRLLSARLMQTVEKKYVERVLNHDEIAFLPMRLLRFETPKDKINAVKAHKENGGNSKCRIINVFYCESTFDPANPMEELFVTINYDYRPKSQRDVKVTLLLEGDKEFAITTFEHHGLMVVFLDEEGRRDESRKYSIDVKDFVIRYIPPHYQTFAQRRWFIEKILKKNEIQYERIEEFVDTPSRAACKDAEIAKARDIKDIIDYEVYRIAHANGSYRPIPGDWDMNVDGERGARYFCKAVVTRVDLPWAAIPVTQRGASSHEKCYAIVFRDATKGMPILNDIITTSFSEPIFRADAQDHIGPQLAPIFRMTILISRTMRIACSDMIKAYDRKMRYTFNGLSENEDPLMTKQESFYYIVRVFEKWESHFDEGMIGVQGWNQRGVRYFFRAFQSMFRPIEFSAEAQPDLLFGVGELFAKSLPEKYNKKVVIDVDKFRRIISIFGDSAKEALHDLETYSQNKSKISVVTDIPLEFPIFDKKIFDLVKGNVIENLAHDLGATMKLRMDRNVPTISFSGTIEMYELLTHSLSILTSEIFQNFTRNNPLNDLQCPVCFTETGLLDDFYRLECGHSMCRPCLNNMIGSRIDEPCGRIKCEVEGCEQQIGPNELQSIILGDSGRVRELDQRKLSRWSARIKQLILNNSNGRMESCTVTDCVGIIEKSDGDIAEAKECVACSQKYCRQCLCAPHPGTTCEQSARLRIPDNSIQEYMRSAGQGKVKGCPSCQALVEKREGCNHIHCACGVHFCWLCLFSDKTPGAIYAHMSSEHDGFGGDYWAVRNGNVIHYPENPNNANNEEMDDLALDMQRLMLGELPDAPQPVNPNIDIALLPPPGLGPPGLDAPRAQFANEAEIEPAVHIREFPQVLLETFPDFYATEDLRNTLLRWVNDAGTLAEQNERLFQMFNWPTERQ